MNLIHPQESTLFKEEKKKNLASLKNYSNNFSLDKVQGHSVSNKSLKVQWLNFSGLELIKDTNWLWWLKLEVHQIWGHAQRAHNLQEKTLEQGIWMQRLSVLTFWISSHGSNSPQPGWKRILFNFLLLLENSSSKRFQGSMNEVNRHFVGPII